MGLHGLKQLGKPLLTRAARFLPVRTGCRALLYHSFDPWVVERVESELRQLMRVARPATTGDLVDALRREDHSFFQEPTFVLTIDDGYLNVFENGFPMFERLGIRPTVFVPVDWIGFDGSNPRLRDLYLRPSHHLMTDPQGSPRQMMSAEQLSFLQVHGWEIGSHSMSHIDLTRPEADLFREVRRSREVLEQLLGDKVTMFSFPHGQRSHISLSVLDAIQAAGYEACFSCSGGRIDVQTDPFFINRDVVDDWWSKGMTAGMYRGVLDRWRAYPPPGR